MQREYLARAPKMRDDYVQEMRDLNTVISQLVPQQHPTDEVTALKEEIRRLKAQPLVS